MQSLWNCIKHPQQPIAFICVGNVWHFEPLCNACVPDHTKNHSKTIKIQLEGVKQVLSKAMVIKKNVSEICGVRLNQCKELIQVQESNFEYIKTLNDRRMAIIKEINSLFDGLIDQTRKNRLDEQKCQRQRLIKLSKSLQESIDFFKKEEYPNVSEFCDQIKKYFFKDNLEVYVQEFDEVIREYREKTIDFTPFAIPTDISLKCTQLIKDICKLREPKEKKVIAQKPVKKQLKKKEVGRKKCPHCGQQMEYLTEWKKHLVCRNCGGKQRNYVKK